MYIHEQKLNHVRHCLRHDITLDGRTRAIDGVFPYTQCSCCGTATGHAKCAGNETEATKPKLETASGHGFISKITGICGVIVAQQVAENRTMSCRLGPSLNGGPL